MEETIEMTLRKLHAIMLKGNEHDEGDLLYYRINYRLADSIHISKEEAESLHSEYHEKNPRRISQGYCDKCQKLVTIIPIIYGVQQDQLGRMRAREQDGRLILGDIGAMSRETMIALFGCRECKSPLPKYGTA